MQTSSQIDRTLSTTKKKTEAAREAHEQAIKRVVLALYACERLGRTGDSAAAREARTLAGKLLRVSHRLFNV